MPATLSSLIFIDATGYHFPDYPTILAWLTGQYQAIYGADVYLGADSQDGQFIAILAKAFYDTGALGASIYNSFSPTTAQGIGLSRVVKINGLSRMSPSFSTVDLTIVGTAGTTINGGSATDTLGQQWNLPATVIIPFGGTVDVIATANLIGFVTAEIGTITTINTPTLGWQTVNNPAAAIPGEPVEADSTLRLRQVVSTSIPAQTVFDATLGAVANVPGVSKVQGYENFTDITDSISMPPHSICVAVVGGATQDIANAITAYKTQGTDPVGNTGPIATVDARGMPVPIKFTIAVTASIQVTADITRLAGWSNNFEDQIKAAIAATINALPIGSEILYTTLFAPAYLAGTPAAGTFQITDIIVGKNGGGQSHTLIVLDRGLQGSGAENPVCNPSVDVTLVVT